MHGDLKVDEEENIVDYLKKELRTMPPITEFLDPHKFKLPFTIDEAQRRFGTNFAHFKGNYLLLFLMFAVIFVVFKPYAILIVVTWASYLFLKKDNTTFNVGSLTVTTRHLLYAAIALTVLILFFIQRMIFTALVIFSVFAFCAFSHLYLYVSKENIDV